MRQQQLRRRNFCEDRAEAAHVHRHDYDGRKGGDVDQNVLDDRDRGRRPQSARIGEGRQNDEGDNQRQIAR